MPTEGATAPLAAQRQAAIVELVRRRGGVRVSELVREFGVSDMTIRRDLEALADRGLITKVHGGATAPTHTTEEPGFTAKSSRQRAEKAAIAAKAATLVTPGAAIGLSAGTTTAELARRLTDVPRLTVVTNSIPVAEIFHRANRADQTVILSGGVRTPSDALVGPVAVTAIRSLNLDLVFLGVHGISERAGLTTPNLMESETDRALVAAGHRLVVLADHTKWGVVGISTIASLEDTDVLVTDDRLPTDAVELLRARVGELLVAKTEKRATSTS